MIYKEFSTFNLSKPILQAIDKICFKKPTQIQKKVVPLILQGKDIIASSKTGSGKSASFILPILEHFNRHKKEGKSKIRVLVLTPTRELTLQVSETFKSFSEFLDKKPKIVSIIGGESIGEQLYDIQQGCDIVVATTGRLLDIFSKKQMNLSYLEFLVLDEADKMLDLGFEKELDQILQHIPKNRQNLLFSATYPLKMQEISKKITTNAILVKVKEQEQKTTDINQRVIEVNRQNRAPLLRELLRKNKWEKTLVFMSNKRATDNIAMKFRRHGFLAESFHGDLDQRERNQTLNDFKEKKIRILFSTDIAARGLHIDDISCVINYDLPRSATDYTHRIGRTGRAGKKGKAITFISHEDIKHFNLIEKRCHISLEKEQIKGFELTGEAPKKVKGLAPIKGKRKSKKDKLREALKNQK